MKETQISIWFLIGLQLTIFGLLICGAGVYGYYYPPEYPTVLSNLHPAIGWGGLMLVCGSFYTIRFRPRRK